MIRDGFLFYRSYYEAIQKLAKKDRLSAYEAIFEYALNENELGLSGAQAAVFMLIKPTLDASNKKAESGRMGGKARSKSEAPVKQTESTAEAGGKDEGHPNQQTAAGEQGVQRGVCDEVAALYNEICVSFPRLKSLSEARKKAIKARLANGYTVESFKELFRKAQASSFLKGKNDRNWQATFDWMIKDTNMAKVIDGNYDDDKGGNSYGAGTDRGRTGGFTTDPDQFKPSGGFKGQ